jgi:hypothetical protein
VHVDNGGMFVTNAMNYHMYPNTFLFSVIDEQGDTNCLVRGFHEYIFDPTIFPTPPLDLLLCQLNLPGNLRRRVPGRVKQSAALVDAGEHNSHDASVSTEQRSDANCKGPK